MDNDCDIDVIAGDFYGQIIYFENTGTETNAAFATPLIDPFWPTASTYMISPEFADVDNDGDLDALIGDVYGFIYFENTGSAFVPAFSGAQTNPYGLVPLPNYMVYFSPNLVDIDNDGDNDAFFHDFYREIFYYENVDNLSPAPQIACCPGPVAECQDFAVNLDLTNFQASILASDIDNGSTADCGLQSITVNPSLFDCSDVGENTVTLTVTDVNGNTDDCTATVTVGF